MPRAPAKPRAKRDDADEDEKHRLIGNRHAAISRAAWSDASYRKRCIDGMKAAWIKRRERYGIPHAVEKPPTDKLRVKRGKNAEAIVQGAIIAWLRIVGFPDAFHVPNGGLRSKSAAARLKWQGVLAGVPDIIVPLPGSRVLWLEVKADKTCKLSVAQKEFLCRRFVEGDMAAVVTSIDDVRAALAENGIATREAK